MCTTPQIKTADPPVARKAGSRVAPSRAEAALARKLTARYVISAASIPMTTLATN
jgi:hypothetical protein